MTDKANLKAWVAALRSGEYRQGKPTLLADDEGGFCCLGVACELAANEGVIEKMGPDPVGTIRYGGTISTLPDEVRDWLGLPNNLGSLVNVSGGRTSLAFLNDGEGSTARDRKSFAEIADVIEREFINE